MRGGGVLLFWSLFSCYALNYRPEDFFVLSSLCRKTLLQHSFWFQKVAQLVVQAFKQLIQQRSLIPSLPTTYKLVWHDATTTFGFPCDTSEYVPPTECKHIVFSKCSFPEVDLVYRKKSWNPRCTSSPKLPLSYKNTTQEYFAAETGSFNLFATTIYKYKFQCQSFTNTVTQH